MRYEGAQGRAETASPASAESVPRAKRSFVRRRVYRDLVTVEPDPDEESAYGEAWPVMVEGRMARAEFREARDRLGKVVAEERLLELEIELIGERKLTLPPPHVSLGPIRPAV